MIIYPPGHIRYMWPLYWYSLAQANQQSPVFLIAQWAQLLTSAAEKFILALPITNLDQSGPYIDYFVTL